MMDDNTRKRMPSVLQIMLLAVNTIAVSGISGFIYITTMLIRSRYEARAFLNTVSALPHDPKRKFMLSLILMAILVLSFIIRAVSYMRHERLGLFTLLLDAVVSAAAIWNLDFNYNGLILLVFADVIGYVKEGKTRLLLTILAIVSYLLTSYQIISVYTPLYHLDDFIQYYPAGARQYAYIGITLLNSMGIILFVLYCIYLISAQRSQIDEVNRLNHELQSANEQLKEYADVSESMAKTRERNRLAREIHDTLGHTLTGLAAGIDACIATIDTSPELTRKQLSILADVSRDGLKEVRRSVSELQPDSLARLSLEVAIRKMITDMSSVSNVQIFFESDIKNLRFDSDEENAIYRVVQESVTNAIRHGHAKKIWIMMNQKDGVLELRVKDNGIGCTEIVNGFGTRHMRERIEMLGGSLVFEGQNGFTVIAMIPIRWGETYD